MSTGKHTPGPWRVEGLTIYALQDEGDMKKMRNRFSARVSDDFSGADVDELLANARLIAAAPALLKALEGTIVLAQALRNDGTKTVTAGGQYFVVEDEISRARAAIRLVREGGE